MHLLSDRRGKNQGRFSEGLKYVWSRREGVVPYGRKVIQLLYSLYQLGMVLVTVHQNNVCFLFGLVLC